MPRRSTLRASDSDREQVAERLRSATAEGRLLAEELEERLGALFAARTYGELDALVSDLPAQQPARRRRTRSVALVLPAVALAVAAAAVLIVLAFAVMVLLTSAWVVWLVLFWWLLGHRRHGRPGPPGRWAGRWPKPARSPFRGGAPF